MKIKYGRRNCDILFVTTIERARSELNGQEITIVLLSGGSSNIRWLGPLLERDLKKKYLADAQILELSESFQEIVAKGLATECARRYHTSGQGDFRAVTYNRLCLALKSDEGELEIRRFRPIAPVSDRGSLISSEEGVLLPSASSLRGLTGTPMRWKVHLSRPPKRMLDYYFLRSSFDTEDHLALYNVESKRVVTPPKTDFQQNIEVELTVREDGTAEPRFIYSLKGAGEEKAVSGRPFYLDMTFAAEETAGETYLGFDFGTSTSAFSYVDSRSISEIEERSQSSGWRELSELVNDLPYVAAAPVARFLSDHHKRMERGREAVEGLLTLAAYSLYADYCANLTRGSSGLFKGLTHRSAGPLMALLRNVSRSAANRLSFSAPIAELISGQNANLLNSVVDEIAKSKHGKETNIDFVSAIGVLGNTLCKVFSEWDVGVFEGVTPKRFAQRQFQGIFRVLRGGSQTFIQVEEYEGPYAFSDTDVFAVNRQTGKAISLAPLFLWGLNQYREGDEPDVYEFDSSKGDQFSYRAVQHRAEFPISENSEFRELWDAIRALRDQDSGAGIYDGLTFSAGAS